MITPLLTCLTSIYLCCLTYNPVGGLPQEMSLYLTVCFFNCKRFICCKKDQAVETYHCLSYVVLVFYQ